MGAPEPEVFHRLDEDEGAAAVRTCTHSPATTEVRNSRSRTRLQQGPPPCPQHTRRSRYLFRQSSGRIRGQPRRGIRFSRDAGGVANWIQP